MTYIKTTSILFIVMGFIHACTTENSLNKMKQDIDKMDSMSHALDSFAKTMKERDSLLNSKPFVFGKDTFKYKKNSDKDSVQ